MSKLIKRIEKPIYLLIFFVIIIINHYLSRFGIYGSNSYLSFLIKNGPFISIGFAFVGVVLDLDSNPKLISSNPCDYVKGYLVILGVLSATMADVFLAVSFDAIQIKKLKKAPFMEDIFAGLIVLFFLVVVLIWILVMGPPIYLMNLIVGAKARISVSDPEREIVCRVNKETKQKNVVHSNFFTQRPVTATTTILASLLWLLKVILC